MVRSTLCGTFPIDRNPRFKALLDFAGQLTLRPEAVTSDDCAPLKSSGLKEVAVKQAILIVVGFSFINRIADALHFDMLSWRECLLSTRFLHTFGYRLLAGLRRQSPKFWIGTTKSTLSDRGERDIAELVASTRRWLRFLAWLALACKHRVLQSRQRPGFDARFCMNLLP